MAQYFQLLSIVYILISNTVFVIPCLGFHKGISVNDATKYNFLFAVLQRNETENSLNYKGVATQISQNHLLAAAHCLSDYWNITSNRTAITYCLRPGNNLNLNHTNCTIPIPIESVQFHKTFNKTEKCPADDIAIITLKTSIPRTGILPLCRPLNVRKGDELKSVSLKFGDNNTNPYQTNSAFFKINSPILCTANRTNYVRNVSKQFCVTPSSQSVYSERGDSGAPLILTKNSRDCLAGILTCGGQKIPIEYWQIFCSLEGHGDWIIKSIAPKTVYNALKYSPLVIFFYVVVFYVLLYTLLIFLFILLKCERNKKRMLK